LSGSFPKIAKSSGSFVRCQSPLEKSNFDGYVLATTFLIGAKTRVAWGGSYRSYFDEIKTKYQHL